MATNIPLFLFTASIRALKGSQINIVDQTTNQSLCVQLSYTFKPNTTLHNQNHKVEEIIDSVTFT